MIVGIMIVGIVGGIGAGKSTVRRLFAELGAETVDADLLAHEALETPKVRKALRSWLGDRAFETSGKVDRKMVASVVFSNPDKLKELEALVHPIVIRQLEEKVRLHSEKATKGKLLVLDVPLLLSSPLRSRCQEILFVDAPLATRQSRVAERGWTESELSSRESLQTPLDEKKRLSTVIVESSGSLENTREHVKRLYQSWTTDGEP